MIKKKAFTLVETLVVIAVMGIVLPTLFSILFVIIRQQVKVYRLVEVKRQGDFIVSAMENTIRNNAYKIYNGAVEICRTPGTSGNVTSFQDKYGSSFSFSLGGTNLTSSSTVTSPAPTFAFTTGPLNNNKVGISTSSTLLTCSKGSTLYSGPLVNVSFTICFLSGGTCATGVDQASLSYQTSIKLRNFPTE